MVGISRIEKLDKKKPQRREAAAASVVPGSARLTPSDQKVPI
jgi:hypothetical protein